VTPRTLLAILVTILVVLRVVQRVLARRRARAAAAATGFRCPACSAPRVVVTASLALPGDARASSLDLEALACRRCTFRGVAVRAAPRPGGPGIAKHMGYPMTPLEWGRLASALERCPTPKDRACPCAEHRRLGAQRGGTWRGLDEVPHEAGAGFGVA
jgi:hypothetical protein